MASKTAELRELTDAQLLERAESAKEELFNLRFQLATGQLDDSSSIKKVRHEIARIATVMRQRDFEARGHGCRGRSRRNRVRNGERAVSEEQQVTQERGRRKTRTGVVVSDGMDKTVVVRIDRSFRHPLYDKTVRRSKKLAAHDESNEAHVGDRVRVVETRPLSKSKRWRLVEIVEKAK